MKTSHLLPLAVLGLLAACGDNDSGAQGDAPASPGPAASRGALKFDANGLPVFKPGLWLRNETRDGETIAFHVCTGADENAEFAKLLNEERPGCQTDRSSRSGALELSIQCRMDGGEVRSNIRMTGGETAYRAQLETTIIGRGSVQGRDISVTEARWLSECPANMAPGDEVELDQ